MTTKRVQAILGGVLLLQVLLIFAFRAPSTRASRSIDSRPLLPVLEAMSPARLELRGSGDETLVLRKDGERWAIEQADGFPADDTKVADLIDDLQQIRVRRPVVSSDRYHDTFKVADGEFEGRVRVWSDGSDKPAVDLILGTAPNYRAIHARLAGEDPVYEIRGLASYDVRPDTQAWIRKEFVQPDATEVTGFRLTNRHGTFEVEKQDGVWKVVSPEARRDEELDPTVVESFLGAATSIRLNDAAGRAGAATASPEASLALRWSTGEEATARSGEQVIRVGGKVQGKETQRTVGFSDVEFEGTVWESAVKRLLDDGLDDLSAS